MNALRIPATRQQAAPIPAFFAKLARPEAIQGGCWINRSSWLSYSIQRVGKKVVREAEEPAQLIENNRSKTEPPNKLLKIKDRRKKDVRNEGTSQ
jgi:hypothetical protein